eukprot:scaffold898_cov168-Amphora_coffeaeformis.AAC.6
MVVRHFIKTIIFYRRGPSSACFFACPTQQGNVFDALLKQAQAGMGIQSVPFVTKLVKYNHVRCDAVLSAFSIQLTESVPLDLHVQELTVR